MADANSLIDHYRNGDLLGRVVEAIDASGLSTESLTVDDLALFDEFHVGGRAMTARICARLEIAGGHRVLDIGSGVGGPARHIAATTGARVLGVDLTPDFVEVATSLTLWTGLSDTVRFEVGDVQDLDLEGGSFDRATLFHVGMNVSDKTALFAAVHRLLKPGGRFAVYDIMRVGDGDIAYPMPWAADASMSFVSTPDSYASAALDAGFGIFHQLDHRQNAMAFFEAQQERQAETGGPPPLGLQLVMGETTQQKLSHLVAAISTGVLAPVEFQFDA